jgi:hypothetical protein
MTEIPEIGSLVFVDEKYTHMFVWVLTNTEPGEDGRYQATNQRVSFQDSNVLTVIKGRPRASITGPYQNFVRVKNCCLVMSPSVGFFFIEREYLHK